MLQLDWLWPCSQILRSDWKEFPRTNALAYLALMSATKEKSFLTLAPGVNVRKLYWRWGRTSSIRSLHLWKWQTIEKTLASYKICPFSVNYESVMFAYGNPHRSDLLSIRPGALPRGELHSGNRLTLPANVRLGWKCLLRTNSLSDNLFLTFTAGVNF